MTGRQMQNQIMEALQGATGGVLLDVTLGFLPIPANLKAGIVGTGVKALIAIGSGVLMQNMKLVRPATAKAFANGALTVVLHDELKKQVQQFLPNVPMGAYLDYGNNELGYYGSGYNPGPVYLPELTAEGVDTDESGFGAYMDQADYIDDFTY